MRKSALQQLVDTARSLPGDRVSLPLVSVPPAGDPAEGQDLPDMRVLRRQLGMILADLARVLEPEMVRAMSQAMRSWDQADAVNVLSPMITERIQKHRALWLKLRGSSTPGDDAAAVEALLTIDTTVALLTLVEKRMATLVRLRLRSETPELVPQGRPFLDVAAALQEAARAWA